jgi:hypothetical protein
MIGNFARELLLVLLFLIDHPARYLELERAKDTLFHLLEEKKDGFLQLLHATNVSDVETVLKGVPALSPQGLLNFIAMSSSKIASSLETRYWSMVPYRLGDPPLKPPNSCARARKPTVRIQLQSLRRAAEALDCTSMRR